MILQTLFGVHASLASLLLRLAIGVSFIIHGYPKLGANRKGVGDWLKTVGIPSGFALFAGIVEFFGGIALLIGLLTSTVAVLSALWLIATTWLSIAKIKKKFSGGWEIDFLLLVLSLTLAALGGGLFSADHLLGI